jgi:hypothetical protein
MMIPTKSQWKDVEESVPVTIPNLNLKSFFHKHKCSFVLQKKDVQENVRSTPYQKYYETFGQVLGTFLSYDMEFFLTYGEETEEYTNENNSQKIQKEYDHLENIQIKMKDQYSKTVPYFIFYENSYPGAFMINTISDRLQLEQTIENIKQDQMHTCIEKFIFKGCFNDIPVFELICGS